MEFALYDDSLNMASYDLHMDPLDASLSGSSAASSPHISSPSPPQHYLDFGFSYHPGYPFVPYGALDSSAGSQVDVGSMCIAPEALHAPVFFQPCSMAVPLESHHPPAVASPELFDLPPVETSAPLERQSTAESLPELNIVSPDAYPMKKDRQRGNANLLRSAKDPERHHACNMCIRKFKRRADLARHLKRHQGIRQYSCPAKCCPLPLTDRFFFRADARQRHWKASPECALEFYSTEAGLDWIKKNKNRSQKLRGHRRQTTSSRGSSLEIHHDCYDDDEDDDAEYHD